MSAELSPAVVWFPVCDRNLHCVVAFETTTASIQRASVSLVGSSLPSREHVNIPLARTFPERVLRGFRTPSVFSSSFSVAKGDFRPALFQRGVNVLRQTPHHLIRSLNAMAASVEHASRQQKRRDEATDGVASHLRPI